MNVNEMIEEIACKTQDMKNAVVGLESFVVNRFSVTDITVSDINALLGLVAAVRSLATRNQEITENYRKEWDGAKRNEELLDRFLKEN